MIDEQFRNFFIDGKLPASKRTYTVTDADYTLVRNVFIEHGFLQYLPGLLFRIIADDLRAKGVKCFADRSKVPEFANVYTMLVALNLIKSDSPTSTPAKKRTKKCTQTTT